MKHQHFTTALNYITQTLLSMTPAQREQVNGVIHSAQANIAINDVIQPIFEQKPQCPHCLSARFKKWGKTGEIQRYRCKDCCKTFNNKTNTPLSHLRKSHRWQKYTECMQLKLSLREAAKICKISLRTAFLWRHRFLMAQSGVHAESLSGIIEVDEFFMAYSQKGNKNLASTRAARRRGGSSDKRTKEGQVPVLLSVDRSNHLIYGVLDADTGAEIDKHLTPHIKENSVLCSDGAWAYVNIAKKKHCDHKRLISGKNRVLENIYHIQTTNGAIAHFKDWVDRKMRGVATKYLSHYLAWFKELRLNLDNKQILVAAYR